MFVILFSVITRQFPPDFSRIQTSLQNVQKLTQISREIYEQKKQLNTELQAAGSVAETDVLALEELNLKRAEIGAKLLSGSSLPAPPSESDATGENENLRAQILELRVQVSQMQRRLDRLESSTPKAKRGSESSDFQE